MASSLRFCMVTTFYPPYNFGGDGIFVRRLSNELARRGHEVDVIHCLDSFRLLTGGDPAGHYRDHPRVTVHGLQSRWGVLSPLITHQAGFPLLQSARIRRIMRKGFDVIHYHNVSLVGGPGILAYGHGIKLYTMHEHWLVCPTHLLLKFNRAPCTRRHCFLCTLWDRRPPQWWRYFGLLRTAARHIDMFIAPSRYAAARHRELGFRYPIVHLPNFAPARRPPGPEPVSAVDAGELYFLYVGRLEGLKGIQTLIPVFRRYDRAQLWIAGSGSSEAALRRSAEGASRIRFLGQVSAERLHGLYQHAVAVIVPSLCPEISPLVIAEAFQQRTPAIVRDLGGMPEMVQDGRAGFVYRTNDQLIAAMDRLLADPAYRDELGRRGYRTYLSEWTPDVHLERYLELIREIAASREAASAVGNR